MKLLVAIASYGVGNDKYLARLVQEYQSMSFAADVVVCSNVEKPVPAGVELIVGLPTRDPWSLPFAHKKILAERSGDYDLFIYSEDDMLLTERNLRAFLWASSILKDNELAGVFQFECDADGQRSFPAMHANFHWDPQSVEIRGSETFAYFTCEHSACYVLTRAQLQRAIASGGFLVPPYSGKYDLACTAATDPYTRCGFRKLICISKMEDFLVHHLPNKYVGTRFGTGEEQLRRELDVLLALGETRERPEPLFPTQTRFPDCAFSKDYREPAHLKALSLIPGNVRTVLSYGCGTGDTEARLADRGVRVTAVPLDRVIPGRELEEKCELLWGDLPGLREQLEGRSFDCLLLLNALRFVEDPAAVLATLARALSGPSQVVIVEPNMALWFLRARIRGGGNLRSFRDYRQSGVHRTSHGVLRCWCRQAGIAVNEIIDVVPERRQRASTLGLRFLDPWLGSEMIMAGERVMSGVASVSRQTGLSAGC
jgi:SAM-dependent methyltransferase